MMEQPQPDATADHLVAHIGVKSLLGGDNGADYNYKKGPFYAVGREAEKNPDESPIIAFAELSKMNDRTIKNIDQGAGNLFGKKEALEHKEDNSKDFHELYHQTNNLSQDPELLINHLASQVNPVSQHMPELGAHLSQIAGDAMAILQEHKPDLSPRTPLDKERKPTQSEISKFNKVAQLLDQPLSIFSKVKNGTITGKDVDIVQRAYPGLLNSIREQTMKHLIDHQAAEGAELSAPMRLGLSKLFGQAMDSSLTHLSSNQLALAQMGMAQAANQMPQQPQPSKAGMGKMKTAQMDQTKAQQSVERPQK